MDDTIILPTNDILFKKVFGSTETKHILVGLINDLTPLHIEDLTIENPYNIETYYQAMTQKKLRFIEADIVARLNNRHLVTIEMQRFPKAYFNERALLYTTQKFGSSFDNTSIAQQTGNSHETKYSSLFPVYCLNILDYLMFEEDDDPHHDFVLYNKKYHYHYRNNQNYDLLTIFFLELKKNGLNCSPNIRHWIRFFRTGTAANDAPDYIKDACRVIAYQNLKKEEREMLTTAQFAIEDEKAGRIFSKREGKREGLQDGLKEGLKEGLEEGLKEGLKKGKEEIILNMLRKNQSVLYIHEMTGLEVAAIESLRKQMTPYHQELDR